MPESLEHVNQNHGILPIVPVGQRSTCLFLHTGGGHTKAFCVVQADGPPRTPNAPLYTAEYRGFTEHYPPLPQASFKERWGSLPVMLEGSRRVMTRVFPQIGH